MIRSRLTKALAVLALLGSSSGVAATVNITPSTLTPAVGQTFTLTITADVPNTFAATMGLAFNSSVVSYVSGAALAPWNVFVKNSPANANPTVFDVETPSATAANPGVYNVAVLTFLMIAGGAPNIVINDDGGNSTGWFDATTAEYIPVTYSQFNVCTLSLGGIPGCEPPPPPLPDLPIPGAVWLFSGALVALGIARRRLS